MLIQTREQSEIEARAIVALGEQYGQRSLASALACDPTCTIERARERITSAALEARVAELNATGKPWPSTPTAFAPSRVVRNDEKAVSLEAHDMLCSTGEAEAVEDVFQITGDTAPGMEILIVTKPGHGAVELDGTAFTYTPEAGYVGEDRFEYRARLGDAKSNVAAVSITVYARQEKKNRSPVSPAVRDVIEEGRRNEHRVLKSLGLSVDEARELFRFAIYGGPVGAVR